MIGGTPSGDVASEIEKAYGSFDKFKTLFSTSCVGIQGSGWGWLGYCRKQQRLEMITKPNQDPLTEYVPLLGIDVWEHAYYYDHGPARAEYVKNIWQVINWKNVAERLAAAKNK